MAPARGGGAGGHRAQPRGAPPARPHAPRGRRRGDRVHGARGRPVPGEHGLQHRRSRSRTRSSRRRERSAISSRARRAGSPGSTGPASGSRSSPTCRCGTGSTTRADTTIRSSARYDAFWRATAAPPGELVPPTGRAEPTERSLRGAEPPERERRDAGPGRPAVRGCPACTWRTRAPTRASTETRARCPAPSSWAASGSPPTPTRRSPPPSRRSSTRGARRSPRRRFRDCPTGRPRRPAPRAWPPTARTASASRRPGEAGASWC